MEFFWHTIDASGEFDPISEKPSIKEIISVHRCCFSPVIDVQVYPLLKASHLLDRQEFIFLSNEHNFIWMGFFFLHKIERQSIFQHSIFLMPKLQMAPLKICNPTEFMQDTAASPTARHHLGYCNALIPEDLEMC